MIEEIQIPGLEYTSENKKYADVKVSTETIRIQTPKTITLEKGEYYIDKEIKQLENTRHLDNK